MDTQTVETPKPAFPKKPRPPQAPRESRAPRPTDLRKLPPETQRWRTDHLDTVVRRIRALKQQMRASGWHITAEQAHQLRALRREATRHYTLRARSRGRLHSRQDVIAQDDIARGLVEYYLRLEHAS